MLHNIVDLFKEKVRSFASSKTSRMVIINTVGTYLNIAFSLFFVLLLTRTLGRVEYGAMTVLLNISYILANIMEFGTTATIYSNLPELYKGGRREELLGFIKSTLVYQTLLSVLIIALLIVAFPTLDTHFFKTGESIGILAITAISVLCLIWQNTLSNMFFAVKKFVAANIWLNVANVIKTTIIIVLLYLDRAGTGTVIFTFGVVGPVIFVTLACIHYRTYLPELISGITISRSHLKVRYTMTNFVAQQFFNMGMRMDLFLLSFYGLKNQVADYGLAQKVILTIISTVVSITQVLSPRFSLITRRSQAIYELKKSIKFLAIPTACFAALMLVPDSMFKLLFTGKFVEVGFYTRILGGIFIIFSVGQVFALFHLYTFKSPTILLATNIIFFVVMIAGCLVFIPISGAIAAPVTLAVAMGLTVLMQSVAFGKKLASLED